LAGVKKRKVKCQKKSRLSHSTPRFGREGKKGRGKARKPPSAARTFGRSKYRKKTQTRGRKGNRPTVIAEEEGNKSKASPLCGEEGEGGLSLFLRGGGEMTRAIRKNRKNNDDPPLSREGK